MVVSILCKHPSFITQAILLSGKAAPLPKNAKKAKLVKNVNKKSPKNGSFYSM